MTYTTETLLEKIEQYIATLGLVKPPVTLYEPVEYCLRNGGKRMRPLMTLMGCELFGGNPERALPAAVGLELFHNFTLMHDDIMDQAPMRRGQPTVYKKWNSNAAILSGDVMFALSCQHVMQVPDRHLRAVMEVFNQTVIEVCEGQQYDMDFETMNRVSESDYLNMIRLKTAVLPAACLKIGAIIAGAPQSEVQQLYLFGESIGLAFQLMDDWLDVYGDEKVFGKKTGGDIVANKKTWLYIKAYEMADAGQRQLLEDAFSNRIPNPEEKISAVKGVYTQLRLDVLARQEMEKYYTKAFNHLEKIRVPNPAKQKLRELAEGLFERRM
jgi:geranylgeranyl diphosphate synthase, type II